MSTTTKLLCSLGSILFVAVIYSCSLTLEWPPLALFLALIWAPWRRLV